LFPLVNVSQGTNFERTWNGCIGLTSFPALDVGNGTNFSETWSYCYGLTSFPTLDTSGGTDFYSTWYFCYSLTSFPPLDLNKGTFFLGTWNLCSSLTSFPANMFDNCVATEFNFAWSGCALDQTSVDNILVSLDFAGQSGGTVGISGGTSSPPGAAGLAAKASLEGKGWTVLTN
jgi:hypothetical protein